MITALKSPRPGSLRMFARPCLPPPSFVCEKEARFSHCATARWLQSDIRRASRASCPRGRNGSRIWTTATRAGVTGMLADNCAPTPGQRCVVLRFQSTREAGSYTLIGSVRELVRSTQLHAPLSDNHRPPISHPKRTASPWKLSGWPRRHNSESWGEL